MHGPKLTDFDAVYRTLRCLIGTSEKGMAISKVKFTLMLIGQVARWIEDPLLVTAPLVEDVTWRSKKQSVCKK